MADQEPQTDPSVLDHLTRWLGVGTSIIAPVTLLTALLFYFGYVSSRAQFRYFGLDVDTVGLSTNDFVMRSPQVLLVPLLVVALTAIALLLVHLRLRRHPPSASWVGRAMVLALVCLGAGLVLMLGFTWFGRWAVYALVTPLLIGVGTAALAYLFWMPGAPAWLRRPADDRAGWVRPGVTALALVVVATTMFWATATLAEWTGRGNAMETARHLDELPAVILDTPSRLYLTDGIVQETALPVEGTEGFRYRYRGFRLLIQGEDQMFLVPEQWSASNSTLVVPADGTVRVQFRFVNRAP
ncbi:hypothetical protein MWU75_15475 [Ornithinimicrobium sp. F0845]|uniref:hypothetical protein n=1 Tax=Ornithinimicrobium sp. F0845 TaxID=2926412 RepID=UPI001FF4D1C1|nr:hypothetical protein [Ornithinimicrobium sp. F0845]MCK0113547.1 hypothetical protein [Ornithinimicrobium sp. F0845]